MKEYPTILREVRRKVPIYAFFKIDGSNIRAEWSKKAGWYKFGKRHGLIGQDYHLGKAIDLFKAKYGEDLERIFLKNRLERAIAFCEFWGPRSCFGQHEQEDTHTVTLFDIDIYKKGILEPQEFLRLTEGLEVAPLLYHGNATYEFVEAVHAGTLPGLGILPSVVPEGVVCKSFNDSPGHPLMFKIKTQAWLEKLKAYCSGDEILFKKLM